MIYEEAIEIKLLRCRGNGDTCGGRGRGNGGVRERQKMSWGYAKVRG